MKIIHKNVTEQLVAYFIQKIESGEWVVGEKIPSENRLTAELGVSRASVRQAVSQLAGVGVFETCLLYTSRRSVCERGKSKIYKYKAVAAKWNQCYTSGTECN